MADYSSERYDPKTSLCRILTIDFDGRQLRLVGGKFTYAYKAVSGHSEGGAFDYSPPRQQLKFEGPIPEGKYWVTPSELDDNWINCVLSKNFCADWGRYRLTIHPYPATETFTRGGFFLHGGADAGSAGCIDLTRWMDAFVEDLRREAGDLLECHVPLTVKYT